MCDLFDINGLIDNYSRMHGDLRDFTLVNYTDVLLSDRSLVFIASYYLRNLKTNVGEILDFVSFCVFAVNTNKCRI